MQQLIDLEITLRGSSSIDIVTYKDDRFADVAPPDGLLPLSCSDGSEES